MPVTRFFLGWDEPLTVKVRRYLLPERPAGPVDLEGCLIVVPTRQAGRRLRESLALFCSQHGAALLSATVVPPGYFLRATPSASREASGAFTKAIWTQVLMEADFKSLSGIFPTSRPPRNFIWALQTGEMIQRLREELAEGGYSIQSVVRTFGNELEEVERWDNLARLEALYLERLQKAGYVDACMLKMRAAQVGQLPENIRRVIVAGCPDPTLLALRFLGRLAERMPVEILVHAPPELAPTFDEWGRPTPAAWTQMEIPIPDAAANLALAGGPESQAQHVLRIIAAEAGRIGPADIAVGVPDRSVIPALENALQESGLEAFDPADKPLAGHALYRLLEALVAVATEGSYTALSALLRHGDFLEYISKTASITAGDLLKELDEFQNTYLPLTLRNFHDVLLASGSHAKRERFAYLCRALELVQALVATFSTQRPAAAARACLQAVFADRPLESESAQDEEFAAAAEQLDAVLQELEQDELAALELPTEVQLAILLRRAAEEEYHRCRSRALIDLEGWLELPWNDAPLLIVTGMNEEAVPGGRLSDVFLPDALRSRLGLRNDASRYARDSYLMRAFIEARRAQGRTVLICGKTSARTDPLRPSRLLFRCADAELPERAQRLFDAVSEERAQPHFTVSFKLQTHPPADTPPPRLKITTLNVTAFRDYLACPFRFYLKHVLEMEPLDDTKTEPDARDFGSLVHGALQVLAREPDLRACTDAHRLSRFLEEAAEEWIREHYGAMPPLSVLLAQESARRRLRAAAEIQADLAKAGWEILYTERTCQVSFHNVVVSGRIDRIDRHRESGRLRIIDYKTSDRAETPVQTHLGTVGTESRTFARVCVGGKEQRWKDLQLPLYRLLLGAVEDADVAPPELAYFNLPKTVDDAAVAVWNEFNEVLYESALTCAHGVVEGILKGVFWPPSARVEHDDFGELFYDNADLCFEVPGWEVAHSADRAPARGVCQHLKPGETDLMKTRRQGSGRRKRGGYANH